MNFNFEATMIHVDVHAECHCFATVEPKSHQTLERVRVGIFHEDFFAVIFAEARASVCIGLSIRGMWWVIYKL